VHDLADSVLTRIGNFALKSALYELSATPKPGLVDRNNSGAHDDMDFFTFLSSCSALAEYFSGFASLGFETGHLPPGQAFALARDYGMQAEKAMLTATNGINTHKGLIFALGLVCLSAGRIHQRTHAEAFGHEEVCMEVASLAQGLCARELTALEKKNKLSKGEKVYLEYGVSGARGYAESGYKIIIDVSYPLIRKLLVECGHTVNDAFVQTLLHLIMHVDDTNILSRGGIDQLAYARKCVRRVLELGGIFTREGAAELVSIDQDFISKRISPGGCADLLAVTFMLFCLEHPDLGFKL